MPKGLFWCVLSSVVALLPFNVTFAQSVIVPDNTMGSEQSNVVGLDEGIDARADGARRDETQIVNIL